MRSAILGSPAAARLAQTLPLDARRAKVTNGGIAAGSAALNSMKQYSSAKGSNPEEAAGWLSYVLMWYANPTLRLGAARRLEERDVLPLARLGSGRHVAPPPGCLGMMAESSSAFSSGMPLWETAHVAHKHQRMCST